MFSDLSFMEIFKLIAPILAIEISLKIFCLFLLIKNGTRNFSKLIWALIIIVFSGFGPIGFLLFGRRSEMYD